MTVDPGIELGLTVLRVRVRVGGEARLAIGHPLPPIGTRERVRLRGMGRMRAVRG